MLSTSNIRQINDQIRKELRTVDSFVTSDEDKAAAMTRIVQLKSLLDPQPTADELVNKLAAALTSSTQKSTPTAAETVLEALLKFGR